MSIETRVVIDKIPGLQRTLRQELAGVVREMAFAIEAQAKQNAPVDTGFLRESIYTVTARGRGGRYRQAAKRAGKRAQRDILPEVPNVTSELEAVVTAGAAYGGYVEEGTSRMAAQPYLKPAAEAVQADFIRKIEAVFEKAAR